MSQPFALITTGADIRAQLTALQEVSPNHTYGAAEILGAALIRTAEASPELFQFTDEDRIVVTITTTHPLQQMLDRMAPNQKES